MVPVTPGEGGPEGTQEEPGLPSPFGKVDPDAADDEEPVEDRPAPVLSRLVLAITPFALLALFFLIEWWVTR